LAYKFDPDKKDHLNTKERKNKMPPKETLEKMMVKVGHKFLDVGTGIGYFSIPASRIVGDKGKVYAVDTSKEMLAELEERIKKEGIKNIKIVQGNTYNSDLSNEKVDYVFLSNVLHEVEDKNRLLSNYLKKLKTGGKIGIIEFKKIEIPKGPPVQHKISMGQLKEYYNNLDIEIIKEVAINDYQYGLVGKKNK